MSATPDIDIPAIDYIFFIFFTIPRIQLNTCTMSDVAAPIELPVIDISDPHDPAVGKAMLDAAAKYGFLYVNSKGSDFSAADVDHAFGLV